MQRKEINDENRGVCCRLIRYVVVKLMAGQKDDKSVKKKLIKKESKSDIKIHFKEREEDSEANAISSRSRAETESVIMLVNGSDVKNVGREASFVRPHAVVMAKPEDVMRRSQPKPVSIDIDKKSDAFIQSRLERMRKRL
ncbi:unnamed protein product [Eruca vesicaria subsp. sativa]|uniref:Uncharacterized protein n=1 Tax=Eruca vesicaria subsp. sativa TaxID=29727 RepID=A0ABC8JK77_ERUVS|nr:unnamed protein product [Eruca vesicaria subsp. sativa]